MVTIVKAWKVEVKESQGRLLSASRAKELEGRLTATPIAFIGNVERVVGRMAAAPDGAIVSM
eukprot:7053344-Lingulodinium_polyedra.AAC.1